MVYFFINFENVKEDGLDALSKVKREDKIVIFYSDNTPKVNLALIGVILTRKLNVQVIKAVTGHKNSLDHQMASFVGMTMGRNKEDDYCIVSADMAFSDLVLFYKKKKYRIYRVTQISEYYRMTGEKARSDSI